MTTFPANQALAAFQPFIGDWATTGSHALIADTVLHGKTSFAWHEAGAFIIMRSSIDEDVGVPDGLAIIGTDAGLGSYTMLYYDERGVSRTMQLTVDGAVLRWWRDDPEFMQRYTFILSDDQHTIVSHGEVSRDGGATWLADLELTYRKL